MSWVSSDFGRELTTGHMSKSLGSDRKINEGDASGETPMAIVPLSLDQVRERVREAIASLETQGIADWQILSAWSELIHERGNFRKGEILSMATQFLVDAEVRAQAEATRNSPI